MQNKTLLGGIIGFILGGLLVSIAAMTIEKPHISSGISRQSDNTGMTLHDMTHELERKSGDEFDRAFLAMMIDHHEGAVDMAALADARAKHAEIKDLAAKISAAQKSEIDQMKQWQLEWGYEMLEHMDHGDHPGQPGDPMLREQ